MTRSSLPIILLSAILSQGCTDPELDPGSHEQAVADKDFGVALDKSDGPETDSTYETLKASAQPELDVDTQILSFANGKCMDIPWGAAVVTKVQQYTCIGGQPPSHPPQLFRFAPFNALTEVTIRNSSSHMCVTNDTGNRLIQEPCSPATRQQSFELISYPGGGWAIRARFDSALCVQLPSTDANGGQLRLSFCDNGADQRWYLNTATPSCASHCGGQSDGCWCDTACSSWGDCCPDYEEICVN